MQNGSWSGRWKAWPTAVRVHWQSIRAEPQAYLGAIWLRIRGKRLRSRNRLAVILGGSPAAYDLWQRRHEPPCNIPAQAASTPPIIALIDGRDASAPPIQLQTQLMAENVPSIVIGGRVGQCLDVVATQIDWDAGPWLLTLAPEDRVAGGAGERYRQAIADANAQTRLIYADDDLVDREGRRHSPHFKPRWNAELFEHFDYLTGSCIIQASADDLIECSTDRDWRRQLIQRVAGASAPHHLPQVLHHRPDRPQPRIPATPIATNPQTAGFVWPSISIVIPTRNRKDLLKTCLDGVASTDYPAKEIIVVDNDSDDGDTLAYLQDVQSTGVNIVRHPGKFNFSAIVNHGVSLCEGHMVCLLNNDVEMLSADWLKIMAAQAMRDEIGAVGAQLLYPDGRIQHAGVVVGIGGAAGHAHRLLQPEEPGYFHRHALPQFVTAVTGACLLVTRERFLAVGGLDEHNLPVAFNDVDLCLKLNQRGWQSFYEPRAKLVHHESLSRGFDRDPIGAARFALELAAFRRRWDSESTVDPFHHPCLSRLSEQFVVSL